MCPHMAEGCDWEGELESLERHTNSFAGKCLYVDVDCPNFCRSKRFQRRDLEEHKSKHCPLRPFSCKYCNHKDTFRAVTKKHWPICEKYPVPCPNGCGEEEIERQHLKEHLQETCPLEVIECEFSCDGCDAKFQRRLTSTHMKECTETHLSLIAQKSKKIPELEKMVQQLMDQKKQDQHQFGQQANRMNQQEDLIKQQADEIEKKGDQIKQQGDLIKLQGDLIKQQGNKIRALMMKLQLGIETVTVPPVDITMDGFEDHKKKSDEWHSTPFYSHIGGYKMCLSVNANGYGNGKGTHMSLYVHLMKGDYDDHLKWPFNGDITIELKKKDPPHLQQVISLADNVPDEHVYVRRPTTTRNWGWGKHKCTSHSELYDGGCIQDNKLLLCVSDIAVKNK